ncbi:hypothetical protein MASR2M36_22600 [Providencia sp.]
MGTLKDRTHYSRLSDLDLLNGEPAIRLHNRLTKIKYYSNVNENTPVAGIGIKR